MSDAAPQETFVSIKYSIDQLKYNIETLLYNFPGKSQQEQDQAIQQMLKWIVERFGVHSYAFSYLCAKISGAHGTAMADALLRYYQQYANYPGLPPLNDSEGNPLPERLCAFTCFFLLVTSYLYMNETETLRQFLEASEALRKTCFIDLPLYHDLISRHEKRQTAASHNTTALYYELRALHLLEQKGCANVAVNCSYASTVARMLEKNEQVDTDKIEKARALIQAAVDFNPDYAKYHFVLAKLQFYQAKEIHSYQEKMDRLDAALKEGTRACFLEAPDLQRRVAEYCALVDKIQQEIKHLQNAYNPQSPETFRSDETEEFKRLIIEAKLESDLAAATPPSNDQNGPYVFICYNRSDFKAVYCDLLDLWRNGIPFSYDHGAVQSGNNWRTVIRHKMLDPRCVGVIFYLGLESAISNPSNFEISVLKEKANQLKKSVNDLCFCVNLPRQAPSRLLINAIQDPNRDCSELNSAHIVNFLTAFTDDDDFVRYSGDPLDNRHMPLLINAISQKFGLQQNSSQPVALQYRVSKATKQNNRPFGKPNEDLICADRSHGLFLVLDGITRVHDEYDNTQRSAANEVNRIFSFSVLERAAELSSVSSPDQAEALLRDMALQANKLLFYYRQGRPLSVWQFYPGTVGILAAIWRDQLICVWAGDCLGLLLRGDEKHVIADQQTERAFALGYSKKQLYAEVCNHPNHPDAYGIFNGDQAVAQLLGASRTPLQKGDTVLLSTDGLGAYLLEEPARQLAASTPDQMLEASAPFDCPPRAAYADDKAILRLDIL